MTFCASDLQSSFLQMGSGVQQNQVKNESVGQKITVFDPINRKPYELSYGRSNSDVLSTAGLETYFQNLGSNKRAFLCKKYQVRQCRAQGKCNSIHADRKKIAQLRTLHPVTEDVKESEQTLDVYSEEDGEAITVPLDRIKKTVGLALLLRSGYEKGILCSLNSECELENCPNLHVEPSYLRHLRVMWRMPCCGQQSCREESGIEPKTETYPLLAGVKEMRVLRVGNGSQNVVLPKVMVTVTKGLRELCDISSQPRSGCVHVPMLRICRPHQRRSCKWGEDCNNVHICRKRQWDAISGSSGKGKSNRSTQSVISSSHSESHCSDSNSSGEITSPAASVKSNPVSESVDPLVLPFLQTFRASAMPAGGVNFEKGTPASQ